MSPSCLSSSPESRAAHAGYSISGGLECTDNLVHSLYALRFSRDLFPDSCEKAARLYHARRPAARSLYGVCVAGRGTSRTVWWNHGGRDIPLLRRLFQKHSGVSELFHRKRATFAGSAMSCRCSWGQGAGGCSTASAAVCLFGLVRPVANWRSRTNLPSFFFFAGYRGCGHTFFFFLLQL